MSRKTFLTLVVLLAAGSALALYAYQMQQLPPELQKQLDEVRTQLVEVKKDLPEMSCCTQPQCNFCPLVAGKCPCGTNVKSDTGVCGECYDGWRAGDGRIPGVDPEDVHRLNDEMLKTMYQARAKHFQ